MPPIYGKNAVPILSHRLNDDNEIVEALSVESLKEVNEAHDAFLQSGDHEHLRQGTAVLVHNPDPAHAPGVPDVTSIVIGGETLDEALKSCVGALVAETAGDEQSPEWVASSDGRFAELLAEYYGCEVRDFAGAVAA